MPTVRCPCCHQFFEATELRAHMDTHHDYGPDGQFVTHATLPPEERELGDLRGVPRVYVHTDCGTRTTMPEDIVRSYLRDPYLYMSNQTFCCGCGYYVPFGQCAWTETGENLQEYIDGIRDRVGVMILPAGRREYGPCECCGKPIQLGMGWVHTPELHGAYCVIWVEAGAAQHEVSFDLRLSPWADGPDFRRGPGVSVDRHPAGSGSFVIVDAAGRPMAGDPPELALSRDEVVERGWADTVLAIAAAILRDDPRLASVERA